MEEKEIEYILTAPCYHQKRLYEERQIGKSFFFPESHVPPKNCFKTTAEYVEPIKTEAFEPQYLSDLNPKKFEDRYIETKETETKGQPEQNEGTDAGPSIDEIVNASLAKAFNQSVSEDVDTPEETEKEQEPEQLEQTPKYPINKNKKK